MPVGRFGEQFSREGGMIVLWGGLLSNIPSGWVLCDGNNGTPDLTNAIPKSVKSGDTVASGTGGSDTKTLSSSEMPQHSHGGSTDYSGSHVHNVGEDGNTVGFEVGPKEDGGGITGTSSGGSHSHSVTSFNSAGGGSSFDNRPEFIELAYIMKV